MSTPSLGIGTPQSIADYLVTSIRPNIGIIKEKIMGLKFEKRIYHLFPKHGVSDLNTFIRESKMSIIDSIGKLPLWFDRNEYIKQVIKHVDNLLERDQELREALVQLQKKSDLTDRKTVMTFYEAFDVLNARMHEAYQSFEADSAIILLKSDMPIDYFYLTNKSRLALLAQLNIQKTRSRRLDTELQVARSFPMFRKKAEAFKRELSPLMATGRLVSDLLSKLEFYVDLCNSSKVEEMFMLRPLSIKNMDKSKFQQYLEELEIALASMDKELVAQRGFLVEFEISETTKELQRSLANVILA